MSSVLTSRLAMALLAILSLGPAFPVHAGKLNASALRDGETYDRFIVRFNADTPERNDAATRQHWLDDIGHGAGVGIFRLRRLAVGADVIQSDRKLDRLEALNLMHRLASDPGVEYVELDAIRRPTLTPNDPGYDSQWHYFEPIAGINLPNAWNRSTGSGVVVAVIDTGITPHSDLAGRVVAGYDFISDVSKAGDGNGRDGNPSDEGDWVAANQCNPGELAANSSWHGTHVAGTIAALTNNAKGVAGVAFNARVMPLRVLGHCGGYTSDIADAIVWASGGVVPGVPVNANPAEVINMSLGGEGACDATTQSAINRAVTAGTVVVVAAGNDNDLALNHAPANCSNVITVGAVGRRGARASYSNFGSRVDVAAPGGDGTDTILSTINTGTTTQGAEGYAGYQGTSMATPHVAGTVALMQSARAHSPAQVESILKMTARALPVLCVEGCGAGIVDASLAVAAAQGPVILISDVTLKEGNSGTKLAMFTVRLSQPVATVVTYNIATANGTATANSDYLGKSLTGQAIPAGATTRTFTVPIVGDTKGEADETFLVKLSSVVGVAVGDGQAKGTIINDDVTTLANGIPVNSLAGAAAQQRGFAIMVPAASFDLVLAKEGGTGTPGGTGAAEMYIKFGSMPTTSSFDAKILPSSGGIQISMPRTGTYFVLLVGVTDFSGVSVTGSFRPALYLADVSIAEGDSGTRLMKFTVRLAAATAHQVNFHWGAVEMTATSFDGDFVPMLGNSTIPPGALSGTFSVVVNGDTKVEPNETIRAYIDSASYTGGGDYEAVGTIINDDGPTLSIYDVVISEGDSGSKLASFDVILSRLDYGRAVTFDVATADGTAKAAGNDYVATTLTGETILDGSGGTRISVPIKGDTTVEGNESFFVNLTNANGATIADSQAVGVIVNDDGPTLSVADVSISEGNAGTRVVTFTIRLSRVATRAVTYDIATSNGTAISGSDYVASSLAGQSIPAGQTSKVFNVTIKGDTTVEASETFFVRLTNTRGATLSDGTAVGTIIADDF